MLKFLITGAIMFAVAWLAACGGESNGLEEGTVEWGYSGDRSPDKWGSLSEEYSECSAGKQQSPVDIAGYSPGDGPSVSFEYGDDGTQMDNTGLFVKVNYEGDSRMRVGAREYTLSQAHAHYPSEHTIEGESFPLEMHLVHDRDDGGLAVLSVLYRLGAANAAIQAMIDNAPAAGETTDMDSPIDATSFLPEKAGYYSYPGSLTTPPCSEGVEWLVLSDIQEVSEEQVTQLAALTGGGTNNRPVQPLGGRRITVQEWVGAAMRPSPPLVGHRITGGCPCGCS